MPRILFGLDPMLVALAVLAVTYAFIIWDRLNRAVVALVGAVALVIIGALDQGEAIKGIDWNTIGVLVGMMLMMSIMQRTGMFQFLAIWSAQITRANPAAILLLLQIVTAVVSALLPNVTTVLLMAPVTLAVTRELRVLPYPFLFAEVFASNIGGTATLIGDPPNIMIGSLAPLDFNAFVVHLAPVVVIVLIVQIAIIHLLWGKGLHAEAEHRAHVMQIDAATAITNRRLMWESVVVLAAMTIALVASGALHLEPGTIALAAAAVLMVLDNWRLKPEEQATHVAKTFADVEWITIFFFLGLFVVVHAVEVSGLLHVLANKLVSATGGNIAAAGYSILWASAVLSAALDNIPFVATMIPLIKSTAPAFGGVERLEPLWWCLALGACLGGNGTLIGAAANLTVAGFAERNGIPFGFKTYLRYAFPMMLISIAICNIYVWWRYF